jgi:hypothetical protein
MNLIPSNRHNPCPICESTNGKCRQGRKDQDYWQCMTYADISKGEILGGFKCIGPTSCLTWAQFKPDNSREWSEEKRLEWQQQQHQRQQKEIAAREKLLKNALPIEERDKAIRKLHKHFGLSQRHRDELKNRGLSDEAIDKNLYFSVTPNQKVPIGIPANLPGVKFGEIRGAGSGYACVSFDPQGRATGWQIRLDGATENKYRWAKGEVSSHLNNGELPITSAYPLELKRSFIGMCEGLNKATIAAHCRGQIFSGAASANFPASLEQVKEHLEQASAHLGGNKRVEWGADAGSIQNPHVLSSYRRTWALLEELGYEVLVAWWGQVDKSLDTPLEYQPRGFFIQRVHLLKVPCVTLSRGGSLLKR